MERSHRFPRDSLKSISSSTFVNKLTLQPDSMPHIGTEAQDLVFTKTQSGAESPKDASLKAPSPRMTNSIHVTCSVTKPSPMISLNQSSNGLKATSSQDKVYASFAEIDPAPDLYQMHRRGEEPHMSPPKLMMSTNNIESQDEQRFA